MTDSEKKDLEEQVDALVRSVEAELNAQDSSDTDQTIKSLIKIQKIIAPYLLNQLKSQSRNLFQTRVLDRFASIVNQTISSTVKLREFELKEEVDLNNPKIQLLFSWFIDVIKDSLDESSLDKKAFFDVFSSKLVGWEEKASKKLSKLTFKTIQQTKDIHNPFQ